MKLLSTLVAENKLELTYADNPRLDDASTLLIVRLPKEADTGKSLAWTRYHALDHLQSIIQQLKNQEHPEG